MKQVTFACWATLVLFAAPIAGCGNGDSAGSLRIADNFDDNSKDSEKWGPDVSDDSRANFAETDRTLEYTGRGDHLDRPWIASFMPYNAVWEVQVDIANLAVSPYSSAQRSSLGLAVYQSDDHGNTIRYELYSDFHQVPYRGFHVDIREDGYPHVAADDEIPDLSAGALRVAFDSTLQLLNLSYDEDTSDGYAWVPFVSISVGTGPSADKNVDWEMTDTDTFSLSLYGSSSSETVASGELRADNFLTIGGFAP